jgi:hypothetical protein
MIWPVRRRTIFFPGAQALHPPRSAAAGGKNRQSLAPGTYSHSRRVRILTKTARLGGALNIDTAIVRHRPLASFNMIQGEASAVSNRNAEGMGARMLSG